MNTKAENIIKNEENCSYRKTKTNIKKGELILTDSELYMIKTPANTFFTTFIILFGVLQVTSLSNGGSNSLVSLIERLIIASVVSLIVHFISGIGKGKRLFSIDMKDINTITKDKIGFCKLIVFNEKEKNEIKIETKDNEEWIATISKLTNQ